MATAPLALSRTAIEAHGSTSLLQVGNNYDLENISSGTGPELQRDGAAVTVGEYAGWTLIGAEQVTGGGYDVALKNASTGQYTVWSTDSNGNFIANISGAAFSKQHCAGVSGEHLPPGPQWRWHDRPCLDCDRIRPVRPVWSRLATTIISMALAAAPAPNCNVAARP